MSQSFGGGPPPPGAPASGPVYVDDPARPAGSSQINPYAAPAHPGAWAPHMHAVPGGPWVPCPRCRGVHVTRPTFTWWGGLVGPRIIPEVKCETCGHRYNGKTGGTNTTAIAIYMLVAFFIIFGLLGLGILAIVLL